MANKKRAFVTRAYVENNFVSGGVKLNYILLKGLKKIGYIIDLFCDETSVQYSEIFKEIYPFSEFEKLKQNYDLILSDKACIPSDITYIHDHSYSYRAGKMFSRFNYVLYKIFCFSHHKRRYKEYLCTRENILNCKRVVVSSNVLKNDMISNYGVREENILIIPPPVERYKINKYKNRVFTFGISAVGFARKGGYIILKAIRELKKKNIKFKVKIIYPSKNLMVKILVKLYGIEEYCEFIPTQQDMGGFYNSINALVMPSIIEPFGMVAGEALGMGCPVITASHCGAADRIENGLNGYIYEGNSPYNLADAMFKILNIPYSDYLLMCNSAHESVELLCEENFVKQYLKLMDEI